MTVQIGREMQDTERYGNIPFPQFNHTTQCLLVKVEMTDHRFERRPVFHVENVGIDRVVRFVSLQVKYERQYVVRLSHSAQNHQHQPQRIGRYPCLQQIVWNLVRRDQRYPVSPEKFDATVVNHLVLRREPFVFCRHVLFTG